MIAQIIFFIAGLFLILQGANYLVDGSVNIARRFNISRLAIGLTVVAIGTSAPEFAVNLISALEGESALVLSNISGSNISNILLILGVTALFARIPVERKMITREIPYLLITGLVFVVMILDPSFVNSDLLTRNDGIVLLGFLTLYSLHVWNESKRVNERAVRDKPEGTLWKHALYVFLGMIALVIGGRLMVDAAVSLATAIGISTTLVGVTIVALGTSLPELASSLVAARKDETDLALGNIIGSNVFNVLAVGGLSAVVAPSALIATPANTLDAGFAFFASLLLTALLFVRSKGRKTYMLSRFEGIVMLLFLAGYLYYVIQRG